MKHRLGSLRIDMNATSLSLAQRALSLAPRNISQLLRELDPRRHTDLIEALGPDDEDREWVNGVADTVAALASAGRPLTLADCERTAGLRGQCVVVLFDRGSRFEVRPRDVVMPGVAIARTKAAGLVVMPRIFREICSNGAVIDLEQAEPRQVDAVAVGRALQECLDPGAFVLAVENLRAAARTPIRSWRETLERARPVTPVPALLGEWQRAGDRSGFGLINAATALAHGERDPWRRLERERDAQRLLAALLPTSNVPRSVHGAASRRQIASSCLAAAGQLN